MHADTIATLRGDSPREAAEDSVAGPQRHREVRWALANALQLARLQTDVLVRLEAADEAGDEDGVLRCHVELDDVMARMAEAEQVRTGARAALTGEDDLTCAGCGATAEPVYDRPRLLGYRCTQCGWEGDDPAAQAEAKRAEALEAAAAVVIRSVGVTETALAVLARRGKQARADGISALRDLHEDLAAVDKRLRKTQ